MATPARRTKPASRIRTSTPVIELLELVGRRSTLRILLELRAETLSFRALQLRAGGVSPTLLNSRLHELRQAGLVELSTEGYALTTLGREFDAKLLGLTTWAERWSRRRKPV